MDEAQQGRLDLNSNAAASLLWHMWSDWVGTSQWRMCGIDVCMGFHIVIRWAIKPVGIEHIFLRFSRKKVQMRSEIVVEHVSDKLGCAKLRALCLPNVFCYA